MNCQTDTILRILLTIYEKILEKPLNASVSFYERHRLPSCVLFCIILFCVMFFLNKHTPFVVDDFGKYLSASGLHSPSDWINDRIHFYMGWGGRVIGETLIFIFVSIPKMYFNVLNSLAFVAIVILICLNAIGKWRVSGSLLVMVTFSLVACLPAFGQDVLWISGSSNYLWMMILPLIVLSTWRFYYECERPYFNNKIVITVFFIISVIAGWCQEMTTVGMIVIMVGYMILYRDKLGSVPLFSKFSIAGVFVGAVLLWFAPGNFARAATEHVSHHISTMFIRIFRNAIVLSWPEAGFILFAALIMLFMFSHSKLKSLSGVYIIGAMATAASFSVAGGLHSRVYFYPIVFVIVAVGMLYADLEWNPNIRQMKILITILFVVASCGYFMEARKGVLAYERQWDETVKIIEQQKSNGNYDVIVNMATPMNKFVAAYDLEQVGGNPNRANNKRIAEYYGIKSIISISVKAMK
ncbi:MAG: DUF6056 family protein [Selenomonadaceae bacterium]